MAINYPQFSKLNAADLGGIGGFDLAEAIKSGLNNYKLYHQAKYEPRNLENKAISAEQTNQINAPYAENAGRIFNADIGTKEANLRQLLQKMAFEKQKQKEERFINNLISGKNPTAISDNGSSKSSGIHGYMTPHGFEGSLTGKNGEDYYANTGEDREAERQAIERIDRANQGGSYAPPIPKFAQKISQGISQNNPPDSNNNEQILIPGKKELSRINDIYENYPQYRKQLESKGFKKTQSVKLDPKTGIASVITTMPNGEVRVLSSQNTNSSQSVPLTNDMKTRLQKMVQFAPSVINNLEELKTTYSPAKLGLFPQWKASARNNYERKVRELAESFAVTKGWPNVKGAIDKAEKILMRGDWESTDSYQHSIDTLIDEIKSGMENAQKTLNPNYQPETTNSTSNVIEYVRDANGKLVPKK